MSSFVKGRRVVLLYWLSGALVVLAAALMVRYLAIVDEVNRAGYLRASSWIVYERCSVHAFDEAENKIVWMRATRGDLSSRYGELVTHSDPAFAALVDAVEKHEVPSLEVVRGQVDAADKLTRDIALHGRQMLFLCLALMFGVVLCLAIAARVQAKTVAILAAREKELRFQADHDALTGLANRRKFFREGAEVREGSVILLDVDHFKKINDTLGHEEGDRVLVEVSEALRTELPKELVARIGGEEFVILLAQQNQDDAIQVAERLRERIAEKGRCTCSVGVATRASDESLDDTLRRADALLYRAKERGRNRVRSERQTTPPRV
jgi:diguanylate cyclase (GGDEF)-like protein